MDRSMDARSRTNLWRLCKEKWVEVPQYLTTKYEVVTESSKVKQKRELNQEEDLEEDLEEEPKEELQGEQCKENETSDPVSDKLKKIHLSFNLDLISEMSLNLVFKYLRLQY